MRVVLFDIDGTLLLTGRAGQFAIQEVAGASPVPERSYAGRTDRAIIADQLRALGVAETEANVDDFRRKFVESLARQLPIRQGQVLPGVRVMLERLQRIPNVGIGLLTGNLREAARMKLVHYQLDQYFYREGEALGAFGDSHHDRDDVAREALEDIQRQYCDSIRGDDVWIIGDTPLDVRCARAISARVLAVATGGYPEDELQEAGADLVVPDLERVDAWWREFMVEAS